MSWLESLQAAAIDNRVVIGVVLQDVEATERCADECTALLRAVENTTACTYPPIDAKEVSYSSSKKGVAAVQLGRCSLPLHFSLHSFDAISMSLVVSG